MPLARREQLGERTHFAVRHAVGNTPLPVAYVGHIETSATE